MAEATPKTPKKAAPKAVKAEETVTTTEVKKAVTKAPAKKAKTVAESKPVAEKKPPVTKTASPRKAAEKKVTAKGKAVTDEQRYRMIAEAAYYRAESFQFKSDPLRDWIEAERDIAILLSDTQ